MKLTLIATTDIPAGVYNAEDLALSGPVNLDGDTIQLSIGVDVLAPAVPPAPVSTPQPPPVVSPPPPASTQTATVVATFADGTTATLNLAPGERKAFVAGDVQHGSAVLHADGLSVCIEHGYVGVQHVLSGHFTVAATGTQLFDGDLAIHPYKRTRPFWITQPEPLAAPDVSMFPRLAGGAQASMASAYDKADNSPLGIGCTSKAFETTGERSGLGPVPEWDADCLTNPSADNLRVVRGMSDSAAVWQIHVIDPVTNQVMGLLGNPFVSMLDVCYGVKGNPVVAFDVDPSLSLQQAQAHATVYSAVACAYYNTAYDREELAFWTNYIECLWQNPGYRLASGVTSCQHGQVRGKGRGLYYLLYASKLCEEPCRSTFAQWARDLGSEMAAYYPAQTGVAVDQTGDSGTANPLGVYMQQILVGAVGFAVASGFTEYQAVLDYFAPTLFASMLDYQHELATYYHLHVRDWSNAGAPVADWGATLKFSAASTFTDCPGLAGALTAPEYSQALQTALGRGDQPGDFTGYPTSPTGFPAIAQAAFAMLADYATDQVRAQAAWTKFQKYQRIDYSANPKYNIVPRAA
jgi:hypothetical protein